jgi:hypothetical protein
MRRSEETGFASGLPSRPMLGLGCSISGSNFCVSGVPSTRLLRSEALPSDHVQIGERRCDFQSVQILGQAPLAHLAEAKDVLDHSEHVLNP